MTSEEIKAHLDNNPHALQMVEELIKDPALCARVEAGDMAALQECSDRAKEHFLMLLCDIFDRRYVHGLFKEIALLMSYRVYYKIREGSSDDKR